MGVLTKSVLLFVLVSLSLQALFLKPADAASGAEVSVSVEVVVDEQHYLEIRINGYTIPFSHVKIIEGGNVVVENQLEQNGYFDFQFSITKDTVHEFIIFAEYAGNSTNPVAITVDPNTWELSQTTGLVLPPILMVATPAVVQGNDAIIYGFGPRDAAITLFASFSEILFYTTSDSEGYFESRLNTDEVNPGSYTAYTTATVNERESNQSNVVEFSVSGSELMRPVFSFLNWFKGLALQARTFICSSLFIALLLILFVIWFARNMYVVTGAVYDLASKRLMTEVNVEIRKYGKNKIFKQQLTDQNGEFYFTLKPWSYQILVTKAGYIPYTNLMYIRRGGKKEIWVEIFLRRADQPVPAPLKEASASGISTAPSSV